MSDIEMFHPSRSRGALLARIMPAMTKIQGGPAATATLRLVIRLDNPSFCAHCDHAVNHIPHQTPRKSRAVLTESRPFPKNIERSRDILPFPEIVDERRGDCHVDASTTKQTLSHDSIPISRTCTRDSGEPY